MPQPPDASASGSSSQSHGQGSDIAGAGSSGQGDVSSPRGPSEKMEYSPSSSEGMGMLI